MIGDDDLRDIERLVIAALQSDDHSQLAVLGYGEISIVLGWPVDEPTWACKLLPPFTDRKQLEQYGALLRQYIEELEAAGVEVVETQLQSIERENGTLAAYCVQPVVPRHRLGPNLLADAEPSAGHPLIEAIVETTEGALSQRLGLDAQLSNWALVDDRLLYFDITTPILEEADGRSALDPAIFLSAYPWFLRGAIRRFVVPGLFRRYHSVRSVLRDLCANLIKERLEPWLPAVLESVNRRVDSPITEVEVRRDYRSDAKLWARMQRLRRLDRWWQRRLRRRLYPFLLPEGFVR